MAMKIAIDFDGTCVKHDFPRIGEDIGAGPVLKKLAQAGHKLILFTMRSNGQQHGDMLSDAMAWFAKQHIPLFGINTDPEQKVWTTSPKAHADLYIDDRGLGIPLKVDGEDERPYVDWEIVEQLLDKWGLLKPLQEEEA